MVSVLYEENHFTFFRIVSTASAKTFLQLVVFGKLYIKGKTVVKIVLIQCLIWKQQQIAETKVQT